jgi:transglutaminase-like putative cysteine protease
VATAREAGVTPVATGAAELRLTLHRIDLAHLALGGGRQALTGDTLLVRPEDSMALASRYELSAPPPGLSAWLAPEPLIPSTAPSVVAEARAIVGTERDPTRAARRLLDWLTHHLHRGPGAPRPLALATLAGQPGDCDEATALYVALARAAGLPTRAVAGLLGQGGRFYYHAWAEVYLGDWVPVDPLLGQVPADARHVRFAIGAFAEPFELVDVIGRVGLDIL